MNRLLNSNINDILQNLTDWLDIPETYFERAESRYKAIGNWLGRSESVVSAYDPDVFPQGSFSLGTVIKPTTDEDDYDIDLVCRLHAKKSNLSQKQLKELVGQELEGYVNARGMSSPAKERRRCWRLDYADQDVHFHLDVLPSVPDSELSQDETIAITDNQMPNYSYISANWPRCNPVDYLKWFRQRMEVRLQIMRKEFAEAIKANIKDVPEYKIKTPLQRSIQILKRHRDITYDGHPDDKPISILITTLAAQAYENEGDVPESLQNIVLKMREFIEDRDGVLWVANPASPTDENFADKWQQYPNRKKAFFDWLDSVEVDIVSLFATRDVKSLEEILRSQFGENAANTATKDVTSKHQFLELSKYLVAALDDPSRFDVVHKDIPTWKMRLDKTVFIRAEIMDGYRPTEIFNGDTIQKHHSLRFTAFVKVKKPYEVHWQVVNTGREAQEARCLRGEFYEGHIRKGRRIREESTLYQGMHWVECFIVKEGVCVARSGEFVINISRDVFVK